MTGRFSRTAILVLFAAVAAVPASLAAEGERSLMDLAADLGATIQWDSLSLTAVLMRGPDRLALTVGSPWLVVNQRTRYGVDPVLSRDGGVYLTQTADDRVRQVVTEREARRWRIGVIMIDPGHGGYDPGTSAPADKDTPPIREKDVVLSTSTLLAGLLRAELPGKTILMTRTDDSAVKLEARAEMANAVKLQPNEAMIYVSVHANYGFNTKSKGYEVWVYPSQDRRTVLDKSTVAQDVRDIFPILNGMREDEFNTQSSALAAAIRAGLGVEVGGLTSDRGTKTESWAVVREALMPAVLIELGFLSNEEEASLLGDPVYQGKLAVGIARGILDFVAKFEAATSFLD